MVAVRGSHLLNLQDFVVEQWSKSLSLPENVEQKLIQAWRYAQQCLIVQSESEKKLFVLCKLVWKWWKFCIV